MVPRASLVVVSKDERDLGDTLKLLHPHCLSVGAECIVVDASSGRLDDIRLENPWVRWIDFAAPLGVRFSIPQQRNVGVRAAQTDVIAFCDSGGVPGDEWLDRLTAPILNGSCSATLGPIHSLGLTNYPTINDLPDGTPAPFVPSGNLAFRRDVFDFIGGFDERYEYGSDVDFGIRLSEAGTQVITVRGAEMGITWGGRSRQLKRDWRYGRARGRHIRFLPTRRRKIMREIPEAFVYPALAFGLVPALAVVALTGAWWVLIPWPLAIAVLWWRNRTSQSPMRVLVGHLYFGLGVVFELISGLMPKHPLVAIASKGNFPIELRESLARSGVSTLTVRVSSLSNPGWFAIAKMSGTKIIHTIDDDLVGASRWTRFLARLFKVRIMISRLPENFRNVSEGSSQGSNPVANLGAPIVEFIDRSNCDEQTSVSIDRVLSKLVDEGILRVNTGEAPNIGILTRFDRSTLDQAISAAKLGCSLVVTGVVGLPESCETEVTQCAATEDAFEETLRESVQLVGHAVPDRRAIAVEWARRHEMDHEALSWRDTYAALIQSVN